MLDKPVVLGVPYGHQSWLSSWTWQVGKGEVCHTHNKILSIHFFFFVQLFLKGNIASLSIHHAEQFLCDKRLAWVNSTKNVLTSDIIYWVGFLHLVWYESAAVDSGRKVPLHHFHSPFYQIMQLYFSYSNIPNLFIYHPWLFLNWASVSLI